MNRRTSQDLDALLTRMRKGDRAALARLLTVAESRVDAYARIAAQVQAARKGALRVGITGPAGVGKSSLIDALGRRLRERDQTLAVLATDPTSERTGGALLGDRVRQSAQAPDQGFFFRSMASRGAVGGLSAATEDLVDLLDAFGFQTVILEAVGAGQTEVEVAYVADLTVVIWSPGGGDAVQAMKAGLMEVGDIFVINKADLPDAKQAFDAVKLAVELRNHPDPASVPPVLSVSVLDGTGLDDLEQQIQHRARHLQSSGELQKRQRQRLLRRVRFLTLRLVEREWLSEQALEEFLERHSDSCCAHHLSAELLEQLRRSPRDLPSSS